jgi:DNA-binding transcriptional LysR family regulator
VKEEHDSVNSLIASVEACSGVALVSESVACIAGARLKLLALSPKTPPLIIGAAWLKDRKMGDAAEKFLECAKKIGTARENP